MILFLRAIAGNATSPIIFQMDKAEISLDHQNPYFYDLELNLEHLKLQISRGELYNPYSYQLIIIIVFLGL